MKKTIIIALILINSPLFAQEELLKIYSFEEAFTLQKKETRPIVVFFHTTWCKYCFAMKKNTFTDKEVIASLNNNYYFVSFNAESKQPITIDDYTFENISGVHQITKALATKNNTISYPTTVILNPKKTIDEQIDSFLSAKHLKKLLNKYLKQN